MMKWILFLVVCAGTAFAEPLNLWCSIPPLTSLASEVGGERVRVSCFMKGSQDPHTFSPSAKTVAHAREADLFMSVGMSFAHKIQRTLAGTNPQMKFLDVGSVGDLPPGAHGWLSLPALVAMAEELEAVLSEMDPAGAATYQENLAQFRSKRMQQHQALAELLAPFPGAVFYVYHPALDQFALDYNLQQESVELHGRKPSPKQLLSLIDRALEENVRIVFVQPQFDQRPAKIIAKRIGGQVAEFNPMSEDPATELQQVAEEIARVVSSQK